MESVPDGTPSEIVRARIRYVPLSITVLQKDFCLHSYKELPAHNGAVLRERANRSLRAILKSQFRQGDVDDLVHACKSLALPLLRSRLVNDHVLDYKLGLNLDDIAIDCVADLFVSADSGYFPHLEAYFASQPAETLDDDELLSYLRRLVFSLVNQGLFRLYNSADPTLGKILRNIKIALHHFDSLVQADVFDDQYLMLPDVEPRLELRVLEPEELEAGLRSYLAGTENVPYMLGKLALLLREQSDIAKMVPILLAARTFKSLYTRNTGDEEAGGIPQHNIETEEIMAVVRKTVQLVRDSKGIAYSRKKKVEPELLDAYFRAIERKLILSFSDDGAEKGLKELLSEQLEGMSESEYVRLHRNRIQYLARVTGSRVAQMLKRG